MQLKEYFEKFEINPTLWAKRHGLLPISVQRWQNGQVCPSLPSRRFIQHCTGGHVTDRDWLDVFFDNPTNREVGTVNLGSLAVEEPHTPQAEGSDHGLAPLRDDAHEAEASSRQAAAH